MTLPNVYLVGAPKCGTTSLARWLGGHPEVYLSVPKESFHWASDYPRMRDHYGFTARTDYEALYSGAPAQNATLRVDGSTTYLYSETAVPDILTAVPDARFVVAVRRPADLLVSYHRTQLVALNEDEPDFARAWRRSLAGGLPGTVPLDDKLVDYPRVGRLGAAVGRLMDLAGAGRVHVVVFDDLAREPAATWRALAAFLQIAPEPLPDFVVHNASDKEARSPVLRRLTHRPPAALQAPIRALRQWSRTSDSTLVARTKAAMWRAQAKPQVDATIRAEVTEYLRADTDMLGRRLGRDLAGWLPG